MSDIVGVIMGLGIFGIFLVIMLLPTIIWLWLLIDCIKRDKFKHGSKVVWILLFLFTNLVGMILYYFLEKRAK